MYEFALPTSLSQNLRFDPGQWLWKDGAEQFVQDSACGLLFGVPVHLFRAMVPKADRSIQAAHHDGVVGQVEDFSLFPQGLLRALALGNIARRAEPFHDFALRILERDGTRERPAYAAIHSQNPVFQFEDTFGADGLADGGQHTWMIVRVNVFLKPGAAWNIRVGDKIPAKQRAHLAPVRAHAIHHIRTGHHQGAEAFLTPMQRLLLFKCCHPSEIAAVALRHQAHQNAHTNKDDQGDGVRGARNPELSGWRNNPIIRQRRGERRGQQSGPKAAEQRDQHDGGIEDDENREFDAEAQHQGLPQQKGRNYGNYRKSEAKGWPVKPTHFNVRHGDHPAARLRLPMLGGGAEHHRSSELMWLNARRVASAKSRLSQLRCPQAR